MPTVGVDVGGTFTDFVVLDGQRTRSVKVPSTPHDPAEAILTGLAQCLDEGELADAEMRFLHGSTITTNALIERRGANCGLVVTRGLRGIAQVQSQLKVGPRHSMKRKRPPALVEDRNLFEVTERVGADGEVLVALDEAEVAEISALIVARGLDAVAICFAFSFANRQHELRTKELIEQAAPGCRVFSSAEVLPRIREWPRMSTTILDAYLEPPLVSYVASLVEGLRLRGVVTPKTYLMESNGGVMPFSAATTGGRAIHTLLSGPAAAVQAGRRIAEATGATSLITIDLGGTSCDIAFVQDGEVLEVSGGEVCGYDLYVPMLDIATIGAGGGTIAQVDVAGRLLVGPQSAGASPGPAAYGRGGRQATITDADVVLGYLNPDYFLGGSLQLDSALAAEAVERNVAAPLGLSAHAAALAMVRINDAHMADAIRVCASKRGISLADCSLLACGGAGPVHGVAVAEELAIRTVIVPESPGVFAALGLLCTDVAQDYVQSEIVRLDRIDGEALAGNFKNLEMRAHEEYAAQGFPLDEVVFEREVDARYAGQGFEIRVPVADPADPRCQSLIAQGFHDRHQRIYGHSAEDEAVEVVSYRLRAIVRMPQYSPGDRLAAAADVSVAGGPRTLHFAGGAVTGQVLRRHELQAGAVVEGPAVIEQLDTTTIIPPDWSARVGAAGELVVTRRGGAR